MQQKEQRDSKLLKLAKATSIEIVKSKIALHLADKNKRELAEKDSSQMISLLTELEPQKPEQEEITEVPLLDYD